MKNYDFNSLKFYEFNMKKISRFYSFATILVSILIVTISFIISYQSIKQIWAEKDQLKIIGIQNRAHASYITDTIVCIGSINGILNNASVSDQNGEQKGTKFNLDENKEKHQAMYAIIGNRSSFCYNLKGQKFNQTYRLIIKAEAAQAIVFIQERSIDQILYKRPALVKQINIQAKSGTNYDNYQLLFLSVTLKDKLSLNYQPEKIVTFRKPQQQRSIFAREAQNLTSEDSYLILSSYSIKDSRQITLNQYQITRMNIGQILGVFLSWVQIILLLFGLALFPIIQMNHDLQAISLIFKLKNQSYSKAKMIVAYFKKGWFPLQDRIWLYIDKFDQMKDLQRILKKQVVVKDLCQAEYLTQEENEEGEIEEEEEPVERGIQMYKQSGRKGQSRSMFDASSDETSAGTLQKMTKKLLHFMDPGEQSISIKYRGKGYGSTESFLMTLAFVLGILVFFEMVGLFNIGNEKSIKEKIQDKISLNLKKDQFILQVNLTQNTLIQGRIVDSTMKQIGIFNFSQGTQCENAFKKLQPSSSISVNSTYYCLPKDLELLYSSSTGETRSLNIISNLSVTVLAVQTFYLHSVVSEEQIITSTTSKTQRIHSVDLAQTQIQIISNPRQQQYLNFGITETGSTLYQNPLNGTLYKVKDRIVTVEEENETIFSVIGNAWAISVIIFSVFLLKISKILNKREKIKSIPQEKEMSKSNIIFLLLKMESFENSKKQNELSKMKYYIKKDI